jgi:limonene-1,2-epoxide hydrolase
MPTPTETVTRFLARWADPADLEPSFRETFTPATVWENVGMAVTTGFEEAIALNKSFEESLGAVAIRVENLAVAASGNKVLTERIDTMLDAAGKTVLEAKVMGIFEIEGDKIVAWRDYFDTAGLLPK